VLPVGPINHLAVSKDGKFLAIACSPMSRKSPEGLAYVLKTP
jgi:hypothetical protein